MVETMTRKQKRDYVAREILDLVITMKRIKKTSPKIFDAMMKEINGIKA